MEINNNTKSMYKFLNLSFCYENNDRSDLHKINKFGYIADDTLRLIIFFWCDCDIVTTLNYASRCTGNIGIIYKKYSTLFLYFGIDPQLLNKLIFQNEKSIVDVPSDYDTFISFFDTALENVKILKSYSSICCIDVLCLLSWMKGDMNQALNLLKEHEHPNKRFFKTKSSRK